MTTLREIVLLYRVQLRHTLRTKIGIVMGVVQPLIYLLLFGPMLIKVSRTPGLDGANPWQTFVPGVLVYLALFGPGFAGFGIISDLRAGVIERMRVTPVSRLALLLGRVLRDLTVLAIQIAMVTAVGFALGLRASPVGLLIGLAVLLLLGAGLSSLSLALGVILKSEDQFAPLVTLGALPLMLLSGILLPMQLAPTWLDVASRFNPLRYVVDGVREVFAGHYATRTVAEAFVAAALLSVVCVFVGTRTFHRENA
ncbi:transport permease protein [Longispora fulva]|uniref:Transport permease protein n=1 Tax=Longispora fulva TaxID=619741 RepID=A0A8J7KDN5_9ACTN|nr:ABC transporter permease [Longispora fulva]MBG6134220.1 ABC-2 type transport system permease protein [Longispora fulva]GIG63112.1 transport permease protein [Longispora fulva]